MWKKENPKVQLSVSSGIRAHVFTKKMPTNLQLKLKELANSQNDIMTKLTLLEKIRSTAALKRGWKQEKDKNNWSIENNGQAELEVLEFQNPDFSSLAW